jgi:hypothetical protein
MVDGPGERELLLPLVVLEEVVVVVIPLEVSRQLVTTLWVRPSTDLFAVFIQLMNELNCFLVKVLELGVVEEEEEEEEAGTSPRVLRPLPLLGPVFFETANAV